jgi:hypothetical protein
MPREGDVHRREGLALPALKPERGGRDCGLVELPLPPARHLSARPLSFTRWASVRDDHHGGCSLLLCWDGGPSMLQECMR